MRPGPGAPAAAAQGRTAARAVVGHRGLTLVELLVALAVLALGLSVAGAIMTTIIGTFEAEPAAADAHQRVRSALSVLIDDVHRAGSGFLVRTDDGPGLALPALAPDRVSASGWTVSPTASVLTAWHALRDVGPAQLATAAASGDVTVRLSRPAFCAVASASCGFAEGDDVLIYERHGRMAVATVRAVRPPLDLELAAPLDEPWPAGAVVAVVTVHTYERRSDPATGLSQIVRRRGPGPATPVVDFVTRFEVEWRLGADLPAVSSAPGGAEETATAGPAPPPPGVVDLAAWAAGENCAFFRDAGGVARWRGTAGGPGTVVPLAQLGDGPWCPDAISPTRWDADLARVSAVRLVLGVAVATAALRLDGGLGLRRPPGARPVADMLVDTVVSVGRHGAGG